MNLIETVPFQDLPLDLPGRLRNINLPKKNSIQAILEAIFNSFHAIEEAVIQDGSVQVLLERGNKDLNEVLGQKEFSGLNSVTVIDNGVGFNDDNFNSFCHADSRYKIGRGGKGVGRFTWLKVFKKISILSVFKKADVYYKRSFEFSEQGISPGVPTITDDKKCETRVLFSEPVDEFAKYIPISPLEFGKKIIERNIVHFVEGRCPKISISDGYKDCHLNDLFKSQFIIDEKKKDLKIDSEKFTTRFVRIDAPDFKTDHSILYCGNDCVVKSKSVKALFPDLAERIFDKKDGKSFTVMAIVTGNYLDSNVNQERTGFYFPDKRNEDSLNYQIVLDEIESSVFSKLKEFLSPFIDDVRKRKLTQIKEHIEKKSPQYRILLNHPEYLDPIPLDLSSDKLEIALFRARNDFTTLAKEETQKIILADPQTTEEIETYKENFKTCIEKVNEVGKSSLIDYIINRKLVLDLFNRLLNKKKDGKFHRENEIHRLIFPMGKTSNDVDYSDHNLWLIDERLSYHRYLASDVHVNSSSKPDLVITFDHALAFSEDDNLPISSVVIIEFKRPMREDYSIGQDRENPFVQVNDYINDIRDGKATDKNGRKVIVAQNCRFYCYIMCDMADKITRIANDSGFTPTPDGMGYFKFNPNYSAYFEIISYDKLLKDSNQRNKVLFDKLNLPMKF